MIDKVKKILSIPVNEVIAGQQVIQLLRVYTKLYNNGQPCASCKNSCTRYYAQLRKDGIAMAEVYERAKVRTCIPKFKGNKYIQSTGKKWSSTLLTDDDATMLLKKGYISEKSFIKLPDSYVNNNAIIDNNNTEFILNMLRVNKENKENTVTKNNNKLDDLSDVPFIIDNSISNYQRMCIDEFKQLIIEGKSNTYIRNKYSTVKMIGDEVCTPQLINKIIKLAKDEITK